jgi:phosphate transport system permease protein
MVWLTGGALAVGLFMIVGLLLLVLAQGVATFWPTDLVMIRTAAGDVRLGEVTRSQSFEPTAVNFENLPEGERAAAGKAVVDAGGKSERRLLRTGNFDVSGTHFHWVSDFEVKEETRPEWAVLIERLSWGRFYGFPAAFVVDGEVVAEKPGDVWAKFEEHHAECRDRWEERRRLDRDELGALEHRQDEARLATRKAELEHGKGSAEHAAAERREEEIKASLRPDRDRISAALLALRQENDRYLLRMRTADGEEKDIRPADVVRAFPANRVGALGSTGIYLSRWWEYLTDDPREANSEGGVWPAIFGTVVMTLIMCILVVPFGVLAALYLREYAKGGAIVSTVRIAINNLAGVPSIVFGVFGLGFFCYIIGADVIDANLFAEKLPTPTYGKGGVLWASLTLALLTLPVVIVATEEALAAVPSSMREGSYACGASKWQTIRRIVLPRAMPGIMTGTILAMARGAGEVAPLMLVGASKLAPELPIDGVFPFLHPDRSFMHLGFHIFDLGFHSQNSEAAKPMVYTTTLLLIAIVVFLNVAAIFIRGRLRKRFEGGQF